MIVMSYNIHYCLGTNGVCNPHRILETLQATDAHVIGLQEVKSNNHGLNGGDWAQFLAENLGMELAIGPNQTRKQGYGTAVLSRLPIEGIYDLDITAPGFQPRSCLFVTLRGHMGNIVVANTQLGQSRPERNLQAKLIYDCLMKMVKSRDSLIFVGDFNDRGTISQVHNAFDACHKGKVGLPLKIICDISTSSSTR
jgi:endonuclease/exonuclease/phosphatase family metal-dependent hydrolase